MLDLLDLDPNCSYHAARCCMEVDLYFFWHKVNALIWLIGMQAGPLLFWEFDLCRNVGVLPYDDKVTYFMTKTLLCHGFTSMVMLCHSYL